MRTPRTAVAALLLAALATACSAETPAPPAEVGSAFTPSPAPSPEKKSPAAQACADALGKELRKRKDAEQEVAKPASCDRLSKDQYGQEYADAVRKANVINDILEGHKDSETDG
ncbi:hypothetical protein ACFYVL_26095 [Streptomyces sp. NPDC004111]|uniref:hypothetical protein n=1 Tax=Streptomyces sp. NPDC004111 TaxID=3364690 RepID=UPI0036AF66C5